MPRRFTCFAGSLIALLTVAAPAGAQARGVIMAGPVLGSYTVSADTVEGTTGIAGIAAGVPINALLDFEMEILRPLGALSREYTGTSFSFAPPGSSRADIEQHGVFTRFVYERRVQGVLSFGAAFHPRRSSSRLGPRFFTGVTTQFARERQLREPLRWPAFVSREEILRRQPLENRARRAAGAITLGASLAVDLTPRVVLVPDLRYDYGSIGDEIDNALRAGVRMLYRF